MPFLQRRFTPAWRRQQWVHWATKRWPNEPVSKYKQMKTKQLIAIYHNCDTIRKPKTMEQATVIQLQNVIRLNKDFHQTENIIQSCVDSMFDNDPELEQKLFKRYFETLTHFTKLWCGNYGLMNHCIDKMDLDMPLKEYPWECDICRKYARLIVISLEMSCNLSGRCDELKESDLVGYMEDNRMEDKGYWKRKAERREESWKEGWEKYGKEREKVAKLKEKMKIEKAKNKQLANILKTVDQL